MTRRISGEFFRSLLALTLALVAVTSSGGIRQSPNDPRTYKHITLENKLEVSSLSECLQRYCDRFGFEYSSVDPEHPIFIIFNKPEIYLMDQYCRCY